MLFMLMHTLGLALALGAVAPEPAATAQATRVDASRFRRVADAAQKLGDVLQASQKPQEIERQVQAFASDLSKAEPLAQTAEEQRLVGLYEELLTDARAILSSTGQSKLTGLEAMDLAQRLQNVLADAEDQYNEHVGLKPGEGIRSALRLLWTTTSPGTGDTPVVVTNAEYISGELMREDARSVALVPRPDSRIIDLRARLVYGLNRRSRTYVVGELVDQDKASRFLARNRAQGIFNSVPTGQVRELLGQKCAEHRINVEVVDPYAAGPARQGGTAALVLTGTMCVATEMPGAAEYSAFYRQVSRLADPAALSRINAQEATERALAELTASTGGLPLHVDYTIETHDSRKQIVRTVTEAALVQVSERKFAVPSRYRRATGR